ncbi:TPA: lysozyme, partial [Klebsiella pneumoniae]
YGWTGKVDGKPIKPGMKIDDATADRLLRTGVVSFDQAVSKMLKVSVTQNQYDALVSLAYNIGTRALSTSTLMKKLNAGDVKGAADEFLRWNRSGGKVMAGLTNRRKAEREAFLS